MDAEIGRTPQPAVLELGDAREGVEFFLRVSIGEFEENRLTVGSFLGSKREVGSVFFWWQV